MFHLPGAVTSASTLTDAFANSGAYRTVVVLRKRTGEECSIPCDSISVGPTYFFPSSLTAETLVEYFSKKSRSVDEAKHFERVIREHDIDGPVLMKCVESQLTVSNAEEKTAKIAKSLGSLGRVAKFLQIASELRQDTKRFTWNLMVPSCIEVLELVPGDAFAEAIWHNGLLGEMDGMRMSASRQYEARGVTLLNMSQLQDVGATAVSGRWGLQLDSATFICHSSSTSTGASTSLIKQPKKEVSFHRAFTEQRDGQTVIISRGGTLHKRLLWDEMQFATYSSQTLDLYSSRARAAVVQLYLIRRFVPDHPLSLFSNHLMERLAASVVTYGFDERYVAPLYASDQAKLERNRQRELIERRLRGDENVAQFIFGEVAAGIKGIAVQHLGGSEYRAEGHSFSFGSD